MKRNVVLTLLLVVALVCTPACVGGIPSSLPAPPVASTQTPPQPFLRGFSPIPDSEEAAVGCLMTEQHELIGSAVLITKTHILTAGHCFDGTKVYWFVTNGKEYRICTQILHPFFKFAGIIFYDLAIGVLETECDEIPYRLPKGETLFYQGKPLTAIGYGGGIRKKSDEGTIWYYGTLEEEPRSFKMLPTHGTIWFGDSGGAIIEEDGTLVGIISSMKGRRGRLFENSAVRLDRFTNWIEKVIGENPHEANQGAEDISSPL